MIRVRQVKVGIDEEDKLVKKISLKLGISSNKIKSLNIIKKSLDARRKDYIHYVYEVDCDIEDEDKVLRKNKSNDIFLADSKSYLLPSSGTEKLVNRPIIVGSGPAGLFCAYQLAEAGYQPIVLERGEKVEDRVKTVNYFWENGILNKESNVQFGEGGAGTFSDGKLNTMVKDKEFRGKRVFDIFVKNGAPEEILYLQKPHLGTDLLCNIVKNIREEIIRLGGEFRYSSCVTDIVVKEGKISNIIINGKEEVACSILVLAIGHSARDTFSMLHKRGVEMVSKPFAVGVRIEHPQSMIQMSQYKTLDERLPVADYKLTYTTKSGRGVYSFCMCPGGYVVNSSSEEGRLAINGMSYHDRGGENANSAIVVTVNSKDYGPGVLDGVKFQEKLEEKAYLLGNGKIPVQLYGDFRDGIFSTSFGEVLPAMKGSYEFSDLNEILPSYIKDAIKEAMPNFGKKIKGFDRDDALLAAIESRTSSPVRILRNDLGEANILGIYPCGEGSGYSGGITTSAMDGIKVSEWIIKKYRNLQ